MNVGQNAAANHRFELTQIFSELRASIQLKVTFPDAMGSPKNERPREPLPHMQPGSGSRYYFTCFTYFMRMSFLTDFTPLTLRATSTALFAAACELTKPLS